MPGGSFLVLVLAPVDSTAVSCSLHTAGKIVHRGEISGVITSEANSDTLAVDLSSTAA